MVGIGTNRLQPEQIYRPTGHNRLQPEQIYRPNGHNRLQPEQIYRPIGHNHGLLYNRPCQHAAGGKNWRRNVFSVKLNLFVGY